MAIAYKNIVITPNTGSSLGDPTVVFSGANTTVNTDITLRVYPDSNGTVSFEGSAGQLFSITNDLSGSVFSVNDISGIPLIEANTASQQITLGQYYGNVGIGTTSSSGPLTIDRLNQIVEIRSAGWLMMRPAANTWDYRLRTTGTGSAAIFGVYTGNNTTTPIMTYTAGGNVGIGNTTPTSKLHVSNGNFTINRTYSGSELPFAVLNTTIVPKNITYDTALFQSEDAPTIRLVEVTGIGNYDRTAELTLCAGDGTANTFASASVIGSNTSMIFATGRSMGTAGYLSTNERMRITSTGNVLIGTTTATSAYPVTVYDDTNGGISFRNPINFTGLAQNSNDFYFDVGRGGSAGNLVFRMGSVLTESMRITNAGNVGIGTASPGYKLDVAGTANAAALLVNGSAAVTSATSPWVLVGSTTVTNGAALQNTTLLTSSYGRYMIVLKDMFSITNATTLFMQFYSGGAYQGASYGAAATVLQTGGYTNMALTTALYLTYPSQSSSAHAYYGIIHLLNPANTSYYKPYFGQGTMYNGSSQMNTYQYGGAWMGGTGAITGFQVYCGSGNITGTALIYGAP